MTRTEGFQGRTPALKNLEYVRDFSRWVSPLVIVSLDSLKNNMENGTGDIMKYINMEIGHE